MVSHNNKCIFVHIPKVAGTSFIEMLRDSSGRDSAIEPIERYSSDDYKFSPPAPHIPIRDYLRFGLVDELQYEAYFKFAFVRNPWSRIVSEYKYRHHPYRYSFKKFLFHHFPKPSWDDTYCHVIPQYDFIHDQEGNLLVDFVGRFENIKNDSEHVCTALGLKNVKLHHINKSLSIFRRDNGFLQVCQTMKGVLSLRQKLNTFEHYTEYYDAECIDFVAQAYEKDIETFGYEFGK